MIKGTLFIIFLSLTGCAPDIKDCTFIGKVKGFLTTASAGGAFSPSITFTTIKMDNGNDIIVSRIHAFKVDDTISRCYSFYKFSWICTPDRCYEEFK